MQYRQFYIENSLGNKYYLTDKNFKHFLNQPEGLGFTKSLTTLRIGDNELITDEQYAMPSVTGSIYFYDKTEKAYQDYYDFISFVRYTPLKLYYQTPNMLFPYFMECYLTQVSKGEYSYDGYMSCAVTFYGNALWQNSQESVLTVRNTTTTNGKYYELVRPYYYSGTSLNTIIINNNGDVPVGYELDIAGSVTNPRLIATYDGEIYGLLKLNGTFDVIKINSDDANESIYLENDGSIIANPLGYQDLSIADGVAAITFFKLKVGQSNLSFSCDKISSFDGTVTFKWKDKKVSI